MMKKITITVPSEVSNEEARLFLAIKLFELGKVSLGKAAEIAGYSKLAFMEILGKYKIPVINYSPKDLKEDIENA